MDEGEEKEFMTSIPTSSEAASQRLPTPSDIVDFAGACRFLDSLVNYEVLSGPQNIDDEFKLERMRHFLRLLANPGKGQKFIHVAGTKGKGSTCAILGSVLREAGLRVGMFTSPHLVTIRERMRMGGEPVTEDEFVRLVKRLLPAIGKMESSEEAKPTFFEALFAMALLYFEQQKADVSILEVGLGGRLDVTNVVLPLVAVITNVSIDHTDVLGDTLAKIAAEKAGIIKEERVVVSSVQQPEVREVLLQTSRERRAILFLGNEDFFFQGRAFLPTSSSLDYFGLSHTWEGLEVSLAGRHQVENAATALAVLECLNELWGLPVDEEAVRKGLKNVSWPGRFEIACWQPLVVLDGAHNPHSAQALKAVLEEVLPRRKTVLVFGVGQPHLHKEMAEILWPVADVVIVTQSRHPRALEATTLAAECGNLANGLVITPDCRKAFHEALLLAGKDGLVCVAGSLYLVGNIKAELEGVPPDHGLLVPFPIPSEEQLSLFPSAPTP